MFDKQRVFSKRYQQGSYTIELVFVFVALWGVYLFAADLSHQLLGRADLDRVSFALVNVIKERTRYFEGDVLAGKNLSVTNIELQDMTKVASRMLNTPVDNVALKIESLTNKTHVTEFATTNYKRLNCQTDSIITHADLAPIEKGVVYPLYRVSLCEEQSSWFEPFLNGGSDKTVKIGSSSVMPGR
ncbi:tight adherence pilus pseudopilin TadF [Vibrio sp. Vb339]|uniref:tight adherence pilus pseudopilin TadF n=1 Tax=Vibrio sp. Vb339 TaxID=1192013 RepID=UPI0015534ED4|nr:tight adherence pilus pseudopilin TadF [Vibrio sp. Vb339]